MSEAIPDPRVAVAEKLSKPARQAALDLILPGWGPKNAGDVFAGLDVGQRREVLEVFAPGWGEALMLAFERRGEVLFSWQNPSEVRSPSEPWRLNQQFWMGMKSFAVRLPESPLVAARDLTKFHNIGVIMGAACDLPEGGQQIYDAVVRGVREAAGERELSNSVVGALASTQRPEAWRLLVELSKDFRFGGYPSYALAGFQGARQLVMESYGAMVDAWERIDFEARGQLYVVQKLPEMRQWVPGMPEEISWLDAAKRQRAYERGTAMEINKALKVERSFDVAGCVPVIEQLRRAPDDWKRAIGIAETFTTHSKFPAEMLDDPEQLVRIAALERYENMDRGSGADAQARHVARMFRVLEKLPHKVSVEIPGVLSYDGAMMIDPAGPELVLMYLKDEIFPMPLNALAPHLQTMMVKSREQLAAMMGSIREKAQREPTATEIGMLGILLKDGKAGVKREAKAAMAKLGLTAKQCELAAAAIPAAPVAVKAALGKWGKLFAKRGEVTGCEYRFGPSATEEQLGELEKQFAMTLPPMLRELLTEGDGAFGDGDDAVDVAGTVDIAALTERVRAACLEYEHPPVVEGILFFKDQGTGDYVGICARDVGKHKAGAVVWFDHEGGKVQKGAATLKAWVGRVEGE